MKDYAMLAHQPWPIALAIAAYAANAAFPATAVAQEDPGTPAASARPAALAEVTVYGQHDAQRLRKDAPVAKLVIGEQEVERYGDATVGDVLRRLPGMGFSGPAGVVKDIRFRGLDKGYTQFLINGEPIPTASKDRQIQVDRLPADMIERIEVIRSPSAAMESDGIGGTVNIVLKKTADNLTRLRAAYGKNGSLDVGDVVAQWSRQLGDVDVVLALSHTVGAEDVVEEKDTLNASGAVTQREFKPKPVKKTETLLSPRITWRNGQDRLTLDAFVTQGTEDKTETSSLSNAAGAYTKGADKTENKDDMIARLGIRYDGRAAWGSWFAKAGVQRATVDKDAFSLENNAARVITKRATERERIVDSNHYAGVGASFEAARRHTVSTGLEWRSAEFDNQKTKTENGADKSALADRYNVAERKLMAYVQDEWQLADRQWLTPGVRLEKTSRNATDGQGIEKDGEYSFASPSLHYRWEFAKNTNLRASWSNTAKLPKFDQINPLVTTKSGSLADPDTAGNPKLRPERARGFELGIEKFFQGSRGVLGANLYQRDVTDFIQKTTTLEGGRYVQRASNAAQAKFWGLEFDGRLPLLHKGAHALNLTGSHAELRGRVLNAANGSYGGVKDMPPRITSVGMEWTHQPTRWSVGTHVSYQPGFTTDGLNDNDERELKTRNSSSLLDVYVTKIISPLAELRLVAKNLLSVKKQETTTKYSANGSFASSESKTERSRPTIYLTYEARF
jgi:iron complex outermembrane receptor protein